jgi:hypothetical protein
VQILQPAGWPNSMQLTNGWRAVAPGGSRVFSVVVPTVEVAIWRVPVIYQEDPPMLEALRDRAKGIAYFIAHWRPGHPSNRLVGERASSFIFGPEMVGTSNRPVQGPGASAPDPGTYRIFSVHSFKTNRSPSAAGSRP